MNDLLDILLGIFASLTALGIIVCILTVFVRIIWIAVVYIWTCGAG